MKPRQRDPHRGPRRRRGRILPGPAPRWRRRGGGRRRRQAARFRHREVMRAESRPGRGETQTQAQFTAFSLRYAAPGRCRARTGPWTDVHAIAPAGRDAGRRVAVPRRRHADLYVAVLSPQRPTPNRPRRRAVGALGENLCSQALAARPTDATQTRASCSARSGGGAGSRHAPQGDRQPRAPAPRRSGPGPGTLRSASVARGAHAVGRRLRQVAAALAVAVVVGVGAFAVLHGRSPSQTRGPRRLSRGSRRRRRRW